MKMTQESPEASILESALLTTILDEKPVFPCWKDKTPAIEGGFKQASTDRKKVTRWFSSGKMLIGIPAAGFIIVDLDRHHEGQDGVENWKTLAKEHDPSGEWKNTLMVKTPSGGIHIWFLDPTYPEEPHRNTAGKLAPGIDTRADGGYVILPPSATEAGKYEYINTHSTPIAPAPGWLLKLLKPEPKPRKEHKISEPLVAGTDRAQRYAEKAFQSELHNLQNTMTGGRNHALNRAAFALGQLVAGGLLDESRVVGDLTSVALGIGLSEHEVDLTIASGMAAGAKSPRGIPNV